MNKDKTWYISFYLLLANSMTAFNNQQYRRFPSIFGVEYEVGNWPLTGSMSVVGIQNQGLIVGYVRRLDLLLLVRNRTVSETTADQTHHTASPKPGPYTTGNPRMSADQTHSRQSTAGQSRKPPPVSQKPPPTDPLHC